MPRRCSLARGQLAATGPCWHDLHSSAMACVEHAIVNFLFSDQVSRISWISSRREDLFFSVRGTHQALRTQWVPSKRDRCRVPMASAAMHPPTSRFYGQCIAYGLLGVCDKRGDYIQLLHGSVERCEMEVLLPLKGRLIISTAVP